MDEGELEELFQDAVRGAPPPSFGAEEIVERSRRVSARRRVAIAGGSAAAALLLAGGLGAGFAAFHPPSTATQAAPPAPASTPNGLHIENEPAPAGQPNVLTGPGSAGGRCQAPDQALAAALTRALPEAAGVSPVTASGTCPPGSRAAGFPLRDGPSAGNVSVILSPVGTASPDQARPGDVQRPDGSKQVTGRARSGHVLIVVSTPAPGSAAPFGSRLEGVESQLAEEL